VGFLDNLKKNAGDIGALRKAVEDLIGVKTQTGMATINQKMKDAGDHAHDAANGMEDFDDEVANVAHNSLQKMLEQLQLQGRYLKMNNIEAEIAQTLDKAREDSAKEDIADREKILDQIKDQIKLNAQLKAQRDIEKGLSSNRQGLLNELIPDARDRQIAQGYYEAVNKAQEEGIDLSDEFLSKTRAEIEDQQKLKDLLGQRDIDKQLHDQQKQIDLQFLNNDQREVEATYWEIINAATERGIQLNEKYKDAIHRIVEAQKKQTDQAQKLNNIANGIGDAFGKAFEDAIFHARSFSDIMKSLFMDISKTIIHEMITVQLVKGVSNSIMSAFGATSTPHAQGDIVGGPTYFSYNGGKTGLMGEAGPEAVLPLGRDSSGRLGVRGSGGGGQTIINFHQTVKTNDANSFRQSKRQIFEAARKGLG
jgi:hypothetical protein